MDKNKTEQFTSLNWQSLATAREIQKKSVSINLCCFQFILFCSFSSSIVSQFFFLVFFFLSSFNFSKIVCLLHQIKCWLLIFQKQKFFRVASSSKIQFMDQSLCLSHCVALLQYNKRRRQQQLLLLLSSIQFFTQKKKENKKSSENISTHLMRNKKTTKKNFFFEQQFKSPTNQN